MKECENYDGRWISTEIITNEQIQFKANIIKIKMKIESITHKLRDVNSILGDMFEKSYKTVPIIIFDQVTANSQKQNSTTFNVHNCKLEHETVDAIKRQRSQFKRKQNCNIQICIQFHDV